MTAGKWILICVLVLAVLVAAYVGALLLRRRLLSRGGGVFELTVRVGAGEVASSDGWHLGLGRYHGDYLQWFGLFSLSPVPKRQWNREYVDIVSQRAPEGEEHSVLDMGHVIALCQTSHGHMELAMNRSVFTGLASWMEAGPPGTDWDQRPKR